MKYCKYCSKLLNGGRKERKYCDQSCQASYEHDLYITEWKLGNRNGKRGTTGMSKYIRRYLFEINNNACSQCGWAKIHPKTGLIPLEIDHIDGDCENNKPDNLRLLCPNCHSLTDNYGSLNNSGKGRRSIGIRYVAVAEMVKASA
jgi:hypothetical protein